MKLQCYEFINLFNLNFQYGNSAEFYLNHDESDKILSHKELLKSFGASEELADEMLNDQGKCFVSYNHHTKALLTYFL